MARHDPSDATGMFDLVRLFPRRLRSRTFWLVQVAVGAITAVHYLTEAIADETTLSHLHHIPPILYAFPIIYASLRFGREGGVLTGIWCMVVTAPNIVLWHRSSWEWLVELTQVVTAVSVGMVFSLLVIHEAAARRRAEEMARRVTLMNRQIVRAQEAERLRMSRELHDDTVQSLAYLSNQLDRLNRSAALPPPLQDGLGEMRSVAESTLSGVRQFSRDLRPSILDDFGLAATLEWLTEDFTQRLGTRARLTITGEPRRLPLETELALFRIVQEALRNVEKHADASEVTINVTFEEERVRLSVQDNGKGLDESPSMGDLVASGKLGVTGMYERAQLVGATFDLSSRPGEGTVVTTTLTP
jgi:two-component system, NarL family, sensor histidine kinase DegS